MNQTKLTDEEILKSNPPDLSEEDFERYYTLIEIRYSEIRKIPHKVLNGIPIALTDQEIEEFNRPDPNQGEIDLAMQKNRLINLRKKYLIDTDWYLVREADQPQSYPPDVKNKRVQAREEIKLIQSLNNLQQLEQFSSNF